MSEGTAASEGPCLAEIDALREKIARLLCQANCENPDARHLNAGGFNVPKWRLRKGEAETMLLPLLTAITERAEKAEAACVVLDNMLRDTIKQLSAAETALARKRAR